MKSVYTLAAIGLTLMLGACGKKDNTTAVEQLLVGSVTEAGNSVCTEMRVTGDAQMDSLPEVRRQAKLGVENRGGSFSEGPCDTTNAKSVCAFSRSENGGSVDGKMYFYVGSEAEARNACNLLGGTFSALL